MGNIARRWIFILGIVVPAVAMTTVAIIPTELLAHTQAVCLFKNTLGAECLGCGMTRAVSLALHGELAAALAYNPLVVVVLPLIVGGMVWCAGRLRK
ncbi:MAG: DUF2752 domain-containing protein [Bacteroidetes bacterium]|nr:MAG: DUF2752 domain-containing protein [Bacteroidota bacterium]